MTRELEREEKKLELEIKKAAKMGNKQVMIYYYLLKCAQCTAQCTIQCTVQCIIQCTIHCIIQCTMYSPVSKMEWYTALLTCVYWSLSFHLVCTGRNQLNLKINRLFNESLIYQIREGVKN